MRKILVGVTLSAMLLTLSFPATAQRSRKVVRIGYLGNNQFSSSLSAGGKDLLDELRNRGWIEGRNIVIEQRFWENRVDRLRAQAAELVGLKVDIIVTSTGTAALAAKEATSTIPIVMTRSADAVGQGLVASLARPGGNVTGMTLISPDVTEKQLKLLKDAFPKVSRVAVLRCTRGGFKRRGTTPWSEAQGVAGVLKVHLQSLEVHGPEDIAGAFQAAIRERADALFVFDCSLIPASETVDLAAKSRLPAMYATRRFVDAGGLMMYGASQTDLSRQAAIYVDKILRGAKPADLPAQQPMKFELVINLKTAKQIGVTIPTKVLMWADEVIE